MRPLFRVWLRPAGASRKIVHVDRLSPDNAVLAVPVLAGLYPTRYGYLFDDSTDDVAREPHILYPSPGVAAVRPDARALRAILESGARFVPIKGFLPVWLPRPDGPAELVRLLQRGPVMELEWASDAEFRNLLSREEAERFAGHLLRLKLEGRIQLELEAGI